MPGIASSSPPVLIAHLAAVDHDDPDRRRRRDAAQPRRARGGRAVRHARGAASGAHRSRPRARARHRPGHGRRAAAQPGRVRRRRVPRAAPRPVRVLRRARIPQITAVPGRGYRPAVWMLGSSDFSAQVAGALGLPFSFAHHFASHNTVAALEIYRARVPPVGGARNSPYTMIGVPVICADDDRARALAVGPERAVVRSPPPGPADPAPHARGGGRVRVHPGRARDRPDAGPRRWSAAIPNTCAPSSRRWRGAPAPTS